MNIKIMPGFSEMANVGIASIAVILNQFFAKYEQPTSLEETEQVSPGPVIMPIMAFEPIRLFLKSNAIKNTYLVGRFAVYSKKLEDAHPCSRFILEARTKSKEEFLKDLPPAIRDASFIKDGDQTIQDLLCTLGGIKADKVSYFYNCVNCEGVNTHTFAVIHEFGNVGNPYAVATAYFNIEVTK